MATPSYSESGVARIKLETLEVPNQISDSKKTAAYAYFVLRWLKQAKTFGTAVVPENIIGLQEHVCDSLRAAHASEPWTIERIEQIMRNDPSTWKSALAFELNALTRAAHASETDPNAAKMIERAQELVDMEEYPNL